jgi:hypothetical protein
MFALPQSEADAQYCGFDRVGYWLPVGQINDVIVEDVTEGTTVIERLNSGYEQWATIEETGGAYELNIGNSFEISVKYGLYYYGFV